MPRKPIKAKGKKQEEKLLTDTNLKINRIRKVVQDLNGTEDADDIMLNLIASLKEGGKVPETGKYYIFVYNPKTPNIRYDQNPFVAVTDVFSWGFRGINFHWGETRQYTWDEIVGSLYEVYTSEIKDLQQVPFTKIRLNS
jgi:hypothetical protein